MKKVFKSTSHIDDGQQSNTVVPLKGVHMIGSQIDPVMLARFSNICKDGVFQVFKGLRTVLKNNEVSIDNDELDIMFKEDAKYESMEFDPITVYKSDTDTDTLNRVKFFLHTESISALNVSMARYNSIMAKLNRAIEVQGLTFGKTVAVDAVLDGLGGKNDAPQFIALGAEHNAMVSMLSELYLLSKSIISKYYELKKYENNLVWLHSLLLKDNVINVKAMVVDPSNNIIDIQGVTDTNEVEAFNFRDTSISNLGEIKNLNSTVPRNSLIGKDIYGDTKYFYQPNRNEMKIFRLYVVPDGYIGEMSDVESVMFRVYAIDSKFAITLCDKYGTICNIEEEVL